MRTCHLEGCNNPLKGGNRQRYCCAQHRQKDYRKGKEVKRYCQNLDCGLPFITAYQNKMYCSEECQKTAFRVKKRHEAGGKIAHGTKNKDFKIDKKYLVRGNVSIRSNYSMMEGSI
jgi:hypothetical protein